MIDLGQNPLTPAKGTIDSVRVDGNSSAGQTRYCALVLQGRLDANGDFEVEIPHINGHMRGYRLEQKALYPIGTPAIRIASILCDGEQVIPWDVPPTVSSGIATHQGSTSSADSFPTPTSAAVGAALCNRVRFGLYGGTANGRFSLFMLVRTVG